MLGNLHVRFGVGGGVQIPALHHRDYEVTDASVHDMARAKFGIGMRNLVYNFGRLVSLKRPKKVPKVVPVR